MSRTLLRTLIALVAAVPLASAHGMLESISVGGKTYPAWIGDDHYTAANTGKAPLKYTRKNDVLDNGYQTVESPGITTGGVTEGKLYDDISPVQTIPMSGGDEVVFKMISWPFGHSGPIVNHMAYCGDSCTKVDASTLDWFAIHHSGYDAAAPADSRWPTDVLANNGLTHTINMPTTLPGGAYLLRFELIAMHAVPAQFYPFTAEIILTSTGIAPSSEYLGKFPSMYQTDNMCLTYSIYQGANDDSLLTFVIPGPPVIPGGSSKGNDPKPDGSAGTAPVASPSQASGAVSASMTAAPIVSETAVANVTSASATETTAANATVTGMPIATTEAAPIISAEPVVPTPTDSLTMTGSLAATSAATSTADASTDLPEVTDVVSSEVISPTTSAIEQVHSGSSGSSEIGSATTVLSSAPTETIETTGAAEYPASSVAPTRASFVTDIAQGPSSTIPTVIETASPPVLETSAGSGASSSASAATPAATTADEIEETIIGERTYFKWHGGFYNFKGDAERQRCDHMRNKCLDDANAQPNALVGAAMAKCNSVSNDCYGTIKYRRSWGRALRA